MAEGWLGWVAADLLESSESCEVGGGLQHDEGLVGGVKLLEKVDGGFQLDEAVELVDGEVELPEDG